MSFQDLPEEIRRKKLLLLLNELSSPEVNFVKVEKLLRSGADVDAVDGRFSVLSVAVSNQYVSSDIVLEILKFKPNIHAHRFGFTVLHDAVKNSEIETKTIMLLIQAGADVNAITHDLRTPLHIAIESPVYPNISIVRILLNSGAKVNAETSEGETPLHLTVKKCHSPFSRIGCIDVLKELLQHGASVHSCTKSAFTPLHIAVGCLESIDPNVIKELVKNGADIHAKEVCHGTVCLGTPFKFLCDAYENSLIYDNRCDKDIIMNNYLESIKIMIKYHLFNKNLQNFPFLLGKLNYFIENYALECSAELQKIKSCIFYSDFSLFDVLLGDCDLQFYPHDVVDNIINMLCDDTLPIYSYDLLEAIHKSVLIDKLGRIRLQFSVLNVSGFEVFLNEHCLYKLSNFLSKQDLLNLFKAFKM